MRLLAGFAVVPVALATGAGHAAPANTLDELRFELGACLVRQAEAHPSLEEPVPGARIAIRFTINRRGELQGEPRFTFMSAKTGPARGRYQQALAAALSRCLPAGVTDALGGAIAGRPFTYTFIERRGARSI